MFNMKKQTISDKAERERPVILLTNSSKEKLCWTRAKPLHPFVWLVGWTALSLQLSLTVRGVLATLHLFFLEPFTPSSGLPDSSVRLVQTQLPGLRPQLSRLLRRGRRFLRNHAHSAVCPPLFPVSGTQASTASILPRVANQPGLNVPIPKDILDLLLPQQANLHVWCSISEASRDSRFYKSRSNERSIVGVYVQKYKNKTHAVIKRHQKPLSEAHPEIFLSSGWSISPPEGLLEFGCLWRKDLELRSQTWLPGSHRKSRINAPPGRPSWEAEDCETVWGSLSTKGIWKKVGE